MLTVKQVSERLNVSKGAVYNAIQQGNLEHHRFGSAIRVSEDQLREFLEQTRARTEPDPLHVTQFKHL